MPETDNSTTPKKRKYTKKAVSSSLNLDANTEITDNVKIQNMNTSSDSIDAINNVPTDATLEERVSVLEAEWDEMNKRQSWQEQIHRNVLPNGNVTHFYNMVPSLIIAGLTGFGVTLATLYVVKKMRS